MTIPDIRREIWTAAAGDTARIERAKTAIRFPVEPTEAHYRQLLAHLQCHTPRKKPKTRSAALPDHIKARYREAKLKHDTEHYPNLVKDGHFIEPAYPPVDTDKGGKEFIKNFLIWSGHHAAVTDNKGTRHVTTAPKADLNGKIHQVVTGAVWHRSTATNGQQDVDAVLKHPNHLYGIPWKIEYKTSRDKVRKQQEKYGRRVLQTGGVYSVVWGVEDFLKQYDELMK